MGYAYHSAGRCSPNGVQENMKIYIYGKYQWPCKSAQQFFTHLLEDTIMRAFVNTKPLLFNRLFGKGKWEDYTQEELARKLIGKDLLKIKEEEVH